MVEIERKFLVKSEAFKEQSFKQTHIAQGYLSSHPERTVRIRIKGEQGFITIKGKGNESGTTRLEWEKEIPLDEAKTLFGLCEIGTIEKIRYEVQSGNHIFEIDVFMGDNEGLIVAEVELDNENESFEKPDWVGDEVTQEKRYYNALLAKCPFKDWD